jgi:hypothetical protein
MDDYEEAHQKLDAGLRGPGLTPQVAGRRINTYYRASVQRAARGLWSAGTSGVYTDEEREHLRYAARWLGYEPEETSNEGS